MKIRITALIFTAAVLSILLTGCTCEHEWVEATCLTPKTCSLCQETEGEALDHTWAEVTCAAPKTCTACGEIEGEALPHTWVEANYQDPKTCSECGVTEGEHLMADFEKYGIQTITPQRGKIYDYVTSCYDRPDEKTAGKVKIWEYFTTPEMTDIDKASPYNLPYESGYEWKFVCFEIIFSDENAGKYGYSWRYLTGSYYSNDDYSGSELNDDNRDTINYHGSNEITEIRKIREETSGWIDGENHVYVDLAFHVPAGYDGYVIGFLDASIEWKDGMTIDELTDENTLFFRLD